MCSLQENTGSQGSSLTYPKLKDSAKDGAVNILDYEK